MRVRVKIDLSKPLKHWMKIRRTGDDWFWIKYENVLTFCFICGLLGHSEIFCSRLFETPEHEIIKLYRGWMRDVKLNLLELNGDRVEMKEIIGIR